MRIVRLVVPLMLSTAILTMPGAARAQLAIGFNVTIAPPELPVYEQPPLPAPGYIWTPGYWAYGDEGYYWVPGTWVEPPTVGLLWTPAYWGWSDGVYLFHDGYWGPHVGFYGGINYGFGYGGDGFEGGYWSGGAFAYNRSVNNFGSVNVTNVYNKTVINNTTVNRTSFNGGTGGVAARPTAEQQSFAAEHHVAATAVQTQHIQAARADKSLLASANGGKPAIAATARPGDFSPKNVVPAKAAGGPAGLGAAHPTPTETGHPAAGSARAAASPHPIGGATPIPHPTATAAGAAHPAAALGAARFGHRVRRAIAASGRIVRRPAPRGRRRIRRSQILRHGCGTADAAPGRWTRRSAPRRRAATAGSGGASGAAPGSSGTAPSRRAGAPPRQ
jgi:hypothetical protein